MKKILLVIFLLIVNTFLIIDLIMTRHSIRVTMIELGFLKAKFERISMKNEKTGIRDRESNKEIDRDRRKKREKSRERERERGGQRERERKGGRERERDPINQIKHLEAGTSDE